MDFQNQGQNQIPGQVPGGMPGGMPNMPFSVRPIPQQENGMSTAAMVTGIIGGISTLFLPFYLPCIFAGVSIVLALLSRGGRNRLSSHAKAGLIVSVCSLVLNAFILAGCYYLVFHVPEFKEQFDQAYEQIYGESFEHTIEDAFGADN